MCTGKLDGFIRRGLGLLLSLLLFRLDGASSYCCYPWVSREVFVCQAVVVVEGSRLSLSFMERGIAFLASAGILHVRCIFAGWNVSSHHGTLFDGVG